MSITTLILCGGQGTRLRPVIGDTLPKCLAPIAGRPFLFYVLDYLYAQGVRKFVFCTGFEGEQVQIVTEALWLKSKELHWSHESTPLGTGGALWLARAYCDTDPVLGVNGDTLCKFDLEYLLRRHKEGGRAMTTLCTPEGVSTGVHVRSKAYLNSLAPPDGPYNLLPDRELEEIGVCQCLYEAEEFLDIGTPERYRGAEETLKRWGVIDARSV